MINNIFVYGTLRKAFKNEFFSILEKNSVFKGIGFVQAKLFDLGDYPGAIFTEDSNSLLFGEVYKIKDNQLEHVLRMLDDYENYRQNDLIYSEYIRDIAPVNMGNKQFINAWIYWYNQPVKGKILITNGDYLRHKKINKV